MAEHNELQRKHRNQLLDSNSKDLAVLTLEIRGSKFKLEPDLVKKLVKLCWNTYKKNAKAFVKLKAEEQKQIWTLASLIYDLKENDELIEFYFDLEKLL